MSLLNVIIRAPVVWSQEWYSKHFRDVMAKPLSGVFVEPVQLPVYEVADLPTNVPQGSRAYVSDATAPTWNAALTGGGAVGIPVHYNGAAWRAG